MSSFHLLAGRPRFLYMKEIEIAVHLFDMSLVHWASWCLAVILACFQNVLLCPRIHDVFPVAANKLCALRVECTVKATHGSSSYSG